MNDTTKKAGLIAIVVIALAAAAFGAKSLFAGEKMEITGGQAMPPGYKSEKEQALESQAGGTGGTESKERDLGG